MVTAAIDHMTVAKGVGDKNSHHWQLGLCIRYYRTDFVPTEIQFVRKIGTDWFFSKKLISRKFGFSIFGLPKNIELITETSNSRFKRLFLHNFNVIS
jgi:hypothetical protein